MARLISDLVNRLDVHLMDYLNNAAIFCLFSLNGMLLFKLLLGKDISESLAMFNIVVGVLGLLAILFDAIVNENQQMKSIVYIALLSLLVVFSSALSSKDKPPCDEITLNDVLYVVKDCDPNHDQ